MTFALLTGSDWTVTLAPPLSQQVRETETWVPMKTTQTAAGLGHRDLEGSASDFSFPDKDDADSPYEDEDYDGLDYYDGSGSGDRAEDSRPSAKVRKVCWRRRRSDRRSADSCVSPAARSRRQRDS